MPHSLYMLHTFYAPCSLHIALPAAAVPEVLACAAVTS